MVTGNDQPRDETVLPLRSNRIAASKTDRIERYWDSIRGNRLVPSRCEIDPRGLSGLLGNAFILERISGGLARFRIAGSQLTQAAGLELRQLPLSALFLPGSREILTDALLAVFEEPAVVRFDVTSPPGHQREQLAGSLVLLPLRSDLGDIDRVLGGLVFDGDIGRAPRRLEIAGQSRRSLTGYAGPRHSETPAAVPQRPLRPETTRTQASDIPVTRGHLKLVISNS